jgi:hypothetical protein
VTGTSYMAMVGAWLAELGYPVLPIEPGTKRPGRWRQGAWSGYPNWPRHCRRPTTAQEVEIWSAWPNAAVGIACGAVVGIDIDIVDDGDLAHALDRLARDTLGDTPVLRIGQAPKRLLVYRATDTVRSQRLGPIEILGDGRQFVAFGTHPTTGRTYLWPDTSLDAVALVDLPAVDEAMVETFLEAARTSLPARATRALRVTASARQTSTGELRGTFAAVEAALAFLPNDDLHYDDWVRVGLALKGAVGEDGRELFLAWSGQSAKNIPEATTTAWKSFRPSEIGAGTIYHLARERGWRPAPELVLNGAVAGQDAHPARLMLDQLGSGRAPERPAAVSTAPALPPGFFELDGALKLFVDYILASAIRPQPVLAVGAALAALGALMGRRYRTPTNLRSNLYIIGMAPSGAGKDHARGCIKEAFAAARLERWLGGNRIASGSGLLAALYRHPAQLFQLDEFGQLVRTIADKRRAPRHLSEIWDLFTELATSAGGTYLGAEYADQQQRPRQDIVQPCCCLHATTVPEPFWAGLEQGALCDGSLARFVLFSTDHIPDRQPNPAPVSEVPAALVDALQAIATARTGGGDLATLDLPMVRPEPLVVAMTLDAARLFDALDQDVTTRLRASRGGDAAILARVWENTAKVALVAAVASDPTAPVIRARHAAWARLVVEHGVAALLAGAEAHIATNETELKHKRVLRLIQDAGGNGLGKTVLYDRTRFLTRREREDILSALIESERVELAMNASGGRPGLVYRAR